jgi:hypothetical protein
VAEWSIAAVLKTAEPQGSGGSNPSLSANLSVSPSASEAARRIGDAARYCRLSLIAWRREYRESVLCNVVRAA